MQTVITQLSEMTNRDEQRTEHTANSLHNQTGLIWARWLLQVRLHLVIVGSN
jgi:hypothetical protein